MDLTPLWITFKLALVTTGLLLFLGAPLAWWLARTKSKGKFIVESLVSLPLILPPTVLGFYLLLVLGPQGPFSGLIELFGLKTLAFSFTGLVFGSMVYSLPFVVSPMQDAFSSISEDILDAASTLGSSPLDRFFSVVLPIARPGILTAAVLGFAHTIGEFGVVLMIGGNIPGKTQVVSIAIYENVENLEYTKAHYMSAGLLILSFVLLLIVYGVNRRFRMVNP